MDITTESEQTVEPVIETMTDEEFDSHMETEFDPITMMEESKEREYQEGKETFKDAQAKREDIEEVEGGSDELDLDSLYADQIAHDD
ncbi:MAG: hypothetical protein ACTSWQ_05805, partial [Candidatus Thorarchaeota archaeon]